MFEQLPQIFQSFFDVIASLWPFDSHLRLINVFEIFILGFIAFKIYRFISGSHAEQLVKGIMMLLFLF